MTNSKTWEKRVPCAAWDHNGKIEERERCFGCWVGLRLRATSGLTRGLVCWDALKRTPTTRAAATRRKTSDHAEKIQMGERLTCYRDG
jgi:hypothetical protein